MMSDLDAANRAVHLDGISLRYPEKTAYLGRVFSDTTNSYKIFWFLALLSLLQRDERRSFSLDDIFVEMVVVAWHPVCLYRLSLGRRDKLQDAICRLQRLSQLPANAAPVAVREFTKASKEGRRLLSFMKNYVPMRFLAPWFANQLRGERDSRRNPQIAIFARDSQDTACACPYWITTSAVEFNESWHVFLLENVGVVQAFAEHHLAQYLQARNPNVPGVVNKLRAPMMRQLSGARRFWRIVREGLARAGHNERFQDIYSEQPLSESFAIDHFLPWSFVAHDLLWNLTPVAPSTNSKKGDAIPDINLYLPRLARFHFSAMRAVRQQPRLLEDHVACFKLLPDALFSLGEDGFMVKYREVVGPQVQIAVNQGFQYGWRLCSP